MSRRRILVIGSQCSALGYLSFLPSVALDLYGVMTDPGRGDCVSALEGAGVLIDPTVNEAKDAIRRAYQRAARDEATLFIAYIGHGEKVGEKVGEDFFLMPQDASHHPLQTQQSILPILSKKFTIRRQAESMGWEFLSIPVLRAWLDFRPQRHGLRSQRNTPIRDACCRRRPPRR